jgi:hypothetical protein
MEKVTPSFLFEINEKEIQNPKMLRIVLTENHTRIDFGYTTPWFYEKGGWITISPDTYLQLKDLKQKFILTNTEGIAISPKRLDFESTEDWQFFSLFFEPIPRTDCVFDMIESENPTKNDFNYHGIELNSKNRLELV